MEMTQYDIAEQAFRREWLQDKALTERFHPVGADLQTLDSWIGRPSVCLTHYEIDALCLEGFLLPEPGEIIGADGTRYELSPAAKQRLLT